MPSQAPFRTISSFLIVERAVLLDSSQTDQNLTGTGLLFNSPGSDLVDVFANMRVTGNQ
jgi:hypothetical protein